MIGKFVEEEGKKKPSLSQLLEVSSTVFVRFP